MENKKNKTLLCDLFYKYGSDKCPDIFHNYSPIYFKFLNKKRFEIKNVIEIGIGSKEIMTPIVGEKYQVAASLKAWKEFFTNATIYGLDIETQNFFLDERIKFYYTDQSDVNSLEKTINEIHLVNEKNNFDMILDDGSHIIEHIILSYQTLFKYLNKGGYYIIEDIKKEDLDIFLNMNLFGGKIVKIFEGEFFWDAFIIIEKV